jgi:hypothetical protein
MNLRLTLAQIYTPGWTKRKKLKVLLALTAQAFGEEAPLQTPKSRRALLRQYAELTTQWARKSLDKGLGTEDIRCRLRQSAFRMGQETRKILRISSKQEVMAGARLLYRFLDIDFRGDVDGGVFIGRCSFSPFYSPAVCQLISGLDEGLLAGLSDGGRLEFSERMTSGEKACRALLRFPERLR